MSEITTPQRCRQAWKYFGLTFAVSWTCWGTAALTGQEWTSPPVLALFALGGFGPSVAAAVLLRQDSATSRQEFIRRMWDWRRVRGRWWLAIAALAFGPPLLARLLPLEAGNEAASLSFAAFPVLMVGLVAGLAEEPGWRGYAQDRLGDAYSHLVASLVVGAGWSVWHLPLYFIQGTFQHEVGLSATALLFFLAVIPSSVLYAWVFVNTGRSILAVIVFHALANLAGEMLPVRNEAQAAALGIVVLVAVLIAITRGRSLQGRATRLGESS